MEPRIQYAKTSDGVSIAYWTLGEGEAPLICLSPLWWDNIMLEWEIPGLRKWYEHLASSRMLVRFDRRGMGRSQRGLQDYSRDARSSDLEAVVARLRFERLDLLAFHGPVQTAIALSVRHPKTVSRLVLWGPDLKGGAQHNESLLALAESDWDFAVESIAHSELGWRKGREAHLFAKFILAEREDFLRMARHFEPFDAEQLLRQVTARTLVIELPQDYYSSTPAQHSNFLASNIRDAQLVRLGAGPPAPYEHEESMRLVDEFLDIRPRAAEALPSGTAVILFADIADSTALTERLGDGAFREKARILDIALRAVIREHSGTCIEAKTLGDGVLTVFTGARQAIEAALACAGAGNRDDLLLHLGLHAGDVIREENNVYGGAVNIASRISGLSAPGEVLVSETVRSLARTSAGVRFEDRGQQELKGVGEPVRVWAVREGGA